MKTLNILGGILLGLMYGGKKLKSVNTSSEVKGISGVVEIKSYIQGRVRFNVPSIKYNNSSKIKVENVFENIEAIRSASINTTTSSILISFDESQISVEILMGIIIKILDLDKLIEDNKNPLIIKEINNLKDALNYSVYKETKGLLNFTSLVPLLLMFFALKNLVIQKGRQATNPYTMLYWAYRSLF